MEMTSADVSPCSTPSGTLLNGAPKYGTVIPNRIFVGGIAANTTEQELKQFFSAYGAVKDSKIISDRAGVSKGYGFITFENQEDADRIIKKESDNLVFRDRKLNIGPAVRKQQVLPRAFESPVSPSAVMFSNGIPYTYQNGMAVFATPDTGGYCVPQAQPQTALVVPQTPPMYVQPQYATYQMPMSYASLQTSPQWATSAATAAQWRYMTQSPTAALTATANPYMFAMQPDIMYAQLQAQAFQAADFTDGTILDGSTAVEGSILPVKQNLQQVSQPTTYITEVPSASITVSGIISTQPVTSTIATVQQNPYCPVTVISTPLSTTTTSSVHAATSSPVMVSPTVSSGRYPSVCAFNVGPYKKPITSSFARRAFASPTFLVRNGHKVQCVMVPPNTLSAGHVTIMTRPSEGDITPSPTGHARV